MRISDKNFDRSADSAALLAALKGSDNTLLTRLDALPRQTRIFPQEDEATSFYYLHSGLVGLYHMMENGKVCLIRLLRPGDFFGYWALFGRQFYHCSARVQRSATVTRITPLHPDTFLLDYPALTRSFIQRMAEDLADSDKRLANMAYDKSIERVLHSITWLSEQWPDYDWTWREIAEYAGCETETAIRHSRTLKAQGRWPAMLNVSQDFSPGQIHRTAAG